MTYSQWNENIAHLFFKPDNAGKDIHFYLAKQDLINHFQQNFSDKTDEEIWLDFIHAIKYDQNDNGVAPFSPIQRPLELYNNWNKEDTPPFIAFLILYIMPLTETYEEHFNATNYYGKVNVFFKKYEILNANTEGSIGTINYQQISHLWNELEQWSIITKNCDLGVFELKKFGNPNWIHVGKPFSQCILPPKAITKLPELFFQSGLVPNFSFTRDEFRRIIIRHGNDILGIKESVLDLIRGKKGENELGQTILDIVEREYNKWNGETHHSDNNGASKGIRKNYTLAPLFLQFKINENEGLISFSYRMYSLNDYPEDLKFGNQENIYETNGWSKTLDFAFNKSFEVRDEFNKWIARFPEREVRLFISAGNHQLSTNYWIETEMLSKTDAMYLLCEEKQNDAIRSWGKTFADGNFKEQDLDGLPDNYYLYKILRPTVSHDEIPILTIHTQKSIELVDSLKINFRTFISDFLPEIKINNADGDEMVYMHYKDDLDNQIVLQKKASTGNRWALPTDVDLNRDFYLKVENESFSGNEIPYKVQESDGSALKVDGINLPKRDAFGRRVNDDTGSYYKGSNIANPSKASKRAYSPWGNLYFSIINNSKTQSFTPASFNNHCGNMLAAYLTLKNVFTTEEFFKAFEFYYSKGISECRISREFNLTAIKKASLNFYNYTGFLDYDYETKKIVINPPQLIFIPSSNGKKVLLIGGRDKAFINDLILTANTYKLQVEIREQHSTNDILFLPDVITIKTDSNGEKDIASLANKMGITFSQNDLVQLALKTFSADINSYQEDLLQNHESQQEDYNWARRIFNSDTLAYEKNETQDFDKSFSLVEYKLNEYTYYNNLWKDGKCYLVDKNWGKFLALKQHAKNIILFDGKNSKVAIPVTTPLPKLLAESIVLLSGLAPDFKEINGRYYRVYENIPGVFTENLFLKLGQKPITTNLL
jgi:hypothetical protein